MESLDRENTIFLIACGPIEQHDPQTPLGTDLYIAEYVMHRCAEHLADHDYPVIVAPTGPDSRGEAHAGVYEPMLYIREQLVRKRLLEDLPAQRIEFFQFGEAESFRELGNGLGYTGDLSQATEEIGARITEHYSDRFKDLILRHVRGEEVYEDLRFSSF